VTRQATKQNIALEDKIMRGEFAMEVLSEAIEITRDQIEAQYCLQQREQYRLS